MPIDKNLKGYHFTFGVWNNWLTPEEEFLLLDFKIGFMNGYFVFGCGLLGIGIVFTLKLYKD